VGDVYLTGRLPAGPTRRRPCSAARILQRRHMVGGLGAAMAAGYLLERLVPQRLHPSGAW